MPKHHEAERKINILRSGGNVRPPFNWWNKMLPEIRNEYPHKQFKDIQQILGGIWNKYDTQTKINIINEYQIDDKSKENLEEYKILGDRFI